jgi:PRTRC genetic system protein A
VAASTGLFLEHRSPAFHLFAQIAAVPLPYGNVPEPWFAPIVGTPDLLRALRRFVNHAAASPETEIAGAVVAGPGGHELVSPRSISASSGHVAYEDHIVDDHLVFDLHSHGRMPAFFSATDDRSDLSRRGPYLAVVVGSLGRPDLAGLSLAARLVSPPYLLHLSPTWCAQIVRAVKWLKVG